MQTEWLTCATIVSPWPLPSVEKRKTDLGAVTMVTTTTPLATSLVLNLVTLIFVSSPTRFRLALAFTALLGLARTQVLYSQSFSFPNGTMDLGDGSTIGRGNQVGYSPPNAGVFGDALRLLNNMPSQIATFVLPSNVSACAAYGWNASFQLSFYWDGSGLPEPGDGMTFAWGNLPITTTPSYADDFAFSFASVRALAFSIVTYINTQIAGESSGFRISTNGAMDSPVVNFDCQPIPITPTTTRGTMIVRWSPSHGASFITTGLYNNANFTNVPVPGIVGSSAYVFGFGAISGSAVQQLSIGDVVVMQAPEPDCATAFGSSSACCNKMTTTTMPTAMPTAVTTTSARVTMTACGGGDSSSFEIGQSAGCLCNTTGVVAPLFVCHAGEWATNDTVVVRPVARWRLDGSGGNTTVIDSIGGFNGTFSGAFGVDYKFLSDENGTNYTQFVNPGYVFFTGDTVMFDVGTRDFAVEARVRLRSNSAVGAGVGYMFLAKRNHCGGSPPTSYWELFVQNSQFNFECGDNSTNMYMMYGDADFYETWHTVLVTRRGTTITMLLDGVVFGTKQTPYVFDIAGAGDLFIGAQHCASSTSLGNVFYGDMAYVAFYLDTLPGPLCALSATGSWTGSTAATSMGCAAVTAFCSPRANTTSSFACTTTATTTSSSGTTSEQMPTGTTSVPSHAPVSILSPGSLHGALALFIQFTFALSAIATATSGTFGVQSIVIVVLSVGCVFLLLIIVACWISRRRILRAPTMLTMPADDVAMSQNGTKRIHSFYSLSVCKQMRIHSNRRAIPTHCQQHRTLRGKAFRALRT
jgi:hypothetical protein